MSQISKDIQVLLDLANLVNYEGRKIRLSGDRPTKKDIPSNLISDCERIARIVNDYFESDISIEMAYDLLSIHSQESFCSSFECIDGVSNEVILSNVIGLLEVLEIEE